jgi:hypothetical protein
MNKIESCTSTNASDVVISLSSRVSCQHVETPHLQNVDVDCHPVALVGMVEEGTGTNLPYDISRRHQ